MGKLIYHDILSSKFSRHLCFTYTRLESVAQPKNCKQEKDSIMSGKKAWLPPKYFFSLMLTIALLTGIVSAYSAPQRQSEDPVINENLTYLTLDHYQMNPRSYRQGDRDTDQIIPTAPNLISWSKLVYQTYRHGNWDIYISNDDGSGDKRLTTDGRTEVMPRLNRAANRIVYAVSGGGDYEIFVMNTDGSGVTQLIENGTDDVNPFWSPDGSKIVFESYRDGQPEIYVMNADGSGQTRLTNSGDYDGTPVWSPDGTMIAFSSRRTDGYRIFTMNVDGSNVTQRSNQPYSLHPQWSPDSKKIAFNGDSDNDGWVDVWTMNADGTQQEILYDVYSYNDALVSRWSPDGRYLSLTMVHYIQYQGNWYWDDSYLFAVNMSGTVFGLGNNPTPRRNWYADWQTTDNLKPISQVQPLLALSAAEFEVNWSGSDSGASGLKNFDVQVRDGANGTWTDWITGWPTATFNGGIGGHTYYFRSRARDNAYNLESWPASPDASTTIEAIPPSVSMTALPTYSPRQNLILTWGGTDNGGSGVASYDVQYRQGSNGAWTNLLTNTTATVTSFDGTAGVTYYFRVRGRDKAQNVSLWPTGNGHTSTTLYDWAIQGTVTNNAGVPVANMNTTTTPAAFSALPSNSQGDYGAYVAGTSSSYTVDWNKTGYGDLPATQFSNTGNASFNLVLPPADNVLQNSGFETGVFDPGDWVASGSPMPFITQTIHHTGNDAAYLGSLPTSTKQFLYSNGVEPILSTDGNGVVHMVWQDYTNGAIKYSQRTAYGSWSNPQVLVQSANSVGIETMVATTPGYVHFLWVQYNNSHQAELKYSWRNLNGSWSTPQTLITTNAIWSSQIVVDNTNRVHLIYIDQYYSYYRYQTSNGVWSAQENPRLKDIYKFVVDNQGVPHVVGHYYGYDEIYYSKRISASDWSIPIGVSNNTRPSNVLGVSTTSDGQIHLLYAEFVAAGYRYEIYYRTGWGDNWTTPELLANNGDWNRQGAMTVDTMGNVYLVWITANANSTRSLWYTQRMSTGGQFASQLLYTSDKFLRYIDISLSQAGMLHLTWHEALYTSAFIRYLQMTPEGEIRTLQEEAAIALENLTPATVVDKNNIVHVVWNEPLFPYGVYYMTQAVAGQSGDSILQQQVAVPSAPSVPVLSYLVQLDSMTGAGGPSFVVQVDDGNVNTTLATRQTNTVGWEHSWVDLSAWVGQTVTVTFNMHQVAGRPVAGAFLDEVTLGSTQPDVWVGGSSNKGLPGEMVTYALTYGNGGAAAANTTILTHTLAANLIFVSASIPPSQINGANLVWNLGDVAGGTGPVTILVTVQINAAAPPFTTLVCPILIRTASAELETVNNQASVTLHLARTLYLPFIFK